MNFLEACTDEGVACRIYDTLEKQKRDALAESRNYRTFYHSIVEQCFNWLLHFLSDFAEKDFASSHSAQTWTASLKYQYEKLTNLEIREAIWIEPIFIMYRRVTGLAVSPTVKFSLYFTTQSRLPRMTFINASVCFRYMLKLVPFRTKTDSCFGISIGVPW